VEALGIVEAIDVGADETASIEVGGQGSALETLVLKRCEEALGDGIVPAVPLRLMLRTAPIASDAPACRR
jgi:hypothetical protein